MQILPTFYQTHLKAHLKRSEVLYIAIDRTQWGCINLLMISLIVEVEAAIWVQLKNLGLVPGVSLYLQGVKVTKS